MVLYSPCVFVILFLECSEDKNCVQRADLPTPLAPNIKTLDRGEDIVLLHPLPELITNYLLAEGSMWAAAGTPLAGMPGPRT